MTEQQFQALIEYVRAVAAEEAVLAASGSNEGGYAKAARAAENVLRSLLVQQDRPSSFLCNERGFELRA